MEQPTRTYVEHLHLATRVNKLSRRLEFNTDQQLECCRASTWVLLLNDSRLTQDNPFTRLIIAWVCNIAFERYCKYHLKSAATVTFNKERLVSTLQRQWPCKLLWLRSVVQLSCLSQSQVKSNLQTPSCKVVCTAKVYGKNCYITHH